MNKAALHDLAPSKLQFLDDVLYGLRQPEKSLPCKYFYDERGSQLFEQICELEEYYLTRTEISIMEQHAPEMAQICGQHCFLVEYGSGSSIKTEVLLEHLHEPAAYAPVDISREHLDTIAKGLARRFPKLHVLPICADFTQPFDLPDSQIKPDIITAYFPGSTIGNFGRDDAAALLSQIVEFIGPHGGLLIGVDLKKDRDILEAAYNDREGVTAKFNLNLLVRINEEFDAGIELDAFRHHAAYNDEKGCVEIFIVSEQAQTIWIEGEEVSFENGEAIHTENSHKYSLEEFALLAQRAGFRVERVWTDDKELFSVQYLSIDSSHHSQIS